MSLGFTLTGIVGITRRNHAPRELSLEVRQSHGAIKVERAGDGVVLGEHGIVESGTSVIGVDEEVIKLGIAGARGLQVKFLGRFGDRGGQGRSGHKSEGCEELHLCDFLDCAGGRVGRHEEMIEANEPHYVEADVIVL